MNVKPVPDAPHRPQGRKAICGILARMMSLIVTALTLLVFAGLQPAPAQTDWEVAKTFQIGGRGGWDYLTVDPQTHRLYVPRTTHTMVIDAESRQTNTDLPGPKNAHCVAA